MIIKALLFSFYEIDMIIKALSFSFYASMHETGLVE